MTDRGADRARLDAAGEAWGVLPGPVTLPYLTAYAITALVATGSPRLTNGLFIVVLALLLVATSVGRWRNPALSSGERAGVVVASAGLGVIVGVLVGVVGVV